ncbi:MAG: thiol:disulfide interchange protein DsbA/DsbL [Burkholderiales bacterium]|nr:thiol:disulfide interchange protein DsbA/DsbL [Burkholderiales bacterium]
MLYRREILSAAALLLPTISFASAEKPVQGVDYTVLATPVQTQNPQKIEVLTFFAYTCPHCYTYEKVLEPWVEKLPQDVQFRRVPVAWNDKYAHYSQAYYALEALNKIDPYHDILFNAVIKEGKEMPNLEAIADYLASQGLNKDEFLKAAKSFSAKTKADRAYKTWNAYHIDGTPTNAVNGKYITAPHMVGTREGAIEVMDFLIQKERDARAKK